MDQKALPWFEIRDFISQLKLTEPDAILAYELLKNWDGHLSLDSTGASVYEQFLSNFIKSIAMDRASESHDYAIGRGFHLLHPATFFAARRVSHLVNNLKTRPSSWFTSSSWEDEIEKALGSAIKILKKNYGYKTTNWKHG